MVIKHPFLDFAFELRIIFRVEYWDLKLGEHPWVGANERKNDVTFVIFIFLRHGL